MADVRFTLNIASLAFLALSLLGTPSWAQDKPSATPQQERMKSCNAQAGKEGLKGEERKAFMSECLRADAGNNNLTAQQERMKSCNAQASNQALKGDERKAFMSSCLRGGAASVGATQQDKMRLCNAEASKKQMKGDERKSYMSRCLSG